MADPANTALGRMLTQEITPVVMVLRTPLVEEACRKNGLSFIDMLSPFTVFDNIDVPVRTSSDQPYRLQKFKLRLFYASDIHKPNSEAARERFHRVIAEAADRDATDLCSELPSIEDGLPASKAELIPSWFEVVHKEVVHNSSFSDHEAFDHPVACLLVVSSKDEVPINKFVDLFNTNQLPHILNDGVMDPKVLKHYLLLNDNQEGSPEDASKILSEMKGTFGSNDCRLLCINTSPDDLVENKDNPWSSHKLDASVTRCIGCFLNVDDIDEMKIFLHDFSTKHIIPHMEQKIRLLNQQVSATRKGFRNQIKNLWWRKGKEDTPDTSSGPMYTYSSIESQIRVLGDYAFMLQDYELALSNYRLISTDYKLDKAWKRYAAVQEMMGLAYFMLDQSRKEAEYCMENAFVTYIKLGKSGQQNAIRCGLWWVEMLKAWNQYKEAATVYFRLSGEEPLLSALMLEQASYCYLFSAPPLLRKYGFHLVLSGDSYEKCDQIRHAIRVYRTALSVLKGTMWSVIRDHIHFQLGKWFASLGMSDVAIGHMLEIIACTHQSKAAQELFLRDFIQLVQETGKTFEVCRLQLPIIKLPSLKVIFEDRRTFAAPSAVGVRESVWRSLEEDMIPSVLSAKTNWLELHTKVSSEFKESNICVAGEAIKVEIAFKNPLQIPLQVSNVSLVCRHSEKIDAAEVDAVGAATDMHNDEELRRLIASNQSFAESSSVTSSEVDFSLSGGETLVVQLSATPRAEGMLRTVGVRWKLSGSVVGFQAFEFDDAKKKTTKGRRKSKKSPGSELKFLVIKSLPRLEGSIRHFPKRSYHGEVHRLILELKTQSDRAVKNMKLKISHPRFLLVGNPDALGTEFPAYLIGENPTGSDILSKGREVVSCFSFPEGLIIRGEEPYQCPLWLHAAIPGTISLNVVIYYEIVDSTSIMRYRTLRMTYTLEVLPSLDVTFKINHCPSRFQEVLVRMDVVNKTSSENFQVHQLSAVGNQWELTVLQPFEIPRQYILVGQVLSCFFKLKNVGKTVASEGEASRSSSDSCHVRLGTQAEKRALFNVFRTPIADFHLHERLQRERPDQGVSDFVDFILISQPHGSRNLQLPDQSRVFSHHACHCSIGSTGPIYWLMDGPQTLHHDFSTSFCEIKLKMTIYNSLDAGVSVNISTHDSNTSTSQSTDSLPAASDNQAGWHDVSLVKDMRPTTDILSSSTVKKVQSESISPFIWSGSSSTKVELGPLSSTEIPMQICVFTPGTYDVSNYNLAWKMLPSSGQEPRKDTGVSLGVCPGHSFHINVLQSHENCVIGF